MFGVLCLVALTIAPLWFVLVYSQKHSYKPPNNLKCRCFGQYSTFEKDGKSLCIMCHRDKK